MHNNNNKRGEPVNNEPPIPTPRRLELVAGIEDHEHEQRTRPRIYVASLSDYNAGNLHGEWVDADQDVDELQAAVTAMLARSPEPIAEEFAIHDYEGFGPTYVDEYESLDRVAVLAHGIAEHGRAFAHWANYLGSADWDQLDRFDDCFLGQWPSAEEFAESLLDDMGVDVDAIGPDVLQPYVRVDIDAFARDLGADYFIAEDTEGVYVFDTM
jgi:antirestriction protein